MTAGPSMAEPTSGPETQPTASAAGNGPFYLVMAASTAALGSLAAALSFGGALRTEVTWLEGSGRVTQGGLPIAELGMNVAGTITVGLLLAAAVLLPDAGGGLPPAARRCLHAARGCAAAWAVATVATTVLSVSYLLGKPVTALSGGDLLSYVTDLTAGRALLLVALAGAATAVAAPRSRTAAGAGTFLLIAVAGLLPPVVTGHAAIASDHALAIYSLAVHVVAAAMWTGGLVALVFLAGPLRDRLHQIVPRYSTLAGICFAAVAASGLVNAWVRLGGPAAFVNNRYGLLVMAKALALGALGVLGWLHRARTIPALPRGSAFVRLAAVEIVVMAAAMGLATGLSRTEPPGDGGPVSPAAILLGFELPGPATPRSYLLDWRLDWMVLTLIFVAAALYAGGVLRLRRAGQPWPWGRTAAFAAGLLVVFVAACGGPGRYSMVLFSAHAGQHLALTLLAPVPLLLGAPGTLAERALRAGPPAAGVGARQALSYVAGSPAARLPRHPLVATALMLISLYGFYASPLFEASLRNHVLHSVAAIAFVGAGLLYLRPVAAALRGRGRPAVAALTLLGPLPLHVLFGLAFARTTSTLAGDFYAALGRGWGSSPLHDQRTAGTMMWASTAAVTAALALLLLWRAQATGNGDRGAVEAVEAVEAVDTVENEVATPAGPEGSRA